MKCMAWLVGLFALVGTVSVRADTIDLEFFGMGRPAHVLDFVFDNTGLSFAGATDLTTNMSLAEPDDISSGELEILYSPGEVNRDGSIRSLDSVELKNSLVFDGASVDLAPDLRNLAVSTGPAWMDVAIPDGDLSFNGQATTHIHLRADQEPTDLGTETGVTFDLEFDTAASVPLPKCSLMIVPLLGSFGLICRRVRAA